MRKVKQYWVSVGKVSGFNVDIDVIGISRNGDKVIVRPVSGSGTFEIGKHEIKNSIKNW